MTDAIRTRLADAVDALSDLDTLIEYRASQLPPILLARALEEIDSIATRLGRLYETLAAEQGGS